MVCACTGDNPLAKACGLSSRTDAQTIQFTLVVRTIYIHDTPSCLVIEEHPHTTSEKCLVNVYFVGAIFKTGHTYFKFVIVCNIGVSRDLERTRLNSSTQVVRIQRTSYASYFFAKAQLTSRALVEGS